MNSWSLPVTIVLLACLVPPSLQLAMIQETGVNSLMPSDTGVLKSIAAQTIHNYLGPSGPHIRYLEGFTNAARLRSSYSGYCDEQIGCFSTSDPDFWHPLYRPINVLPQSRENLRSKFLLFTRKNLKEPFVLQPTTRGQPLAKLGPMDIKKPIKVIIPGWLDSRNFLEWLDELKDQLLLNDDMNVIILDWTEGNKPPYTRAVANARVVGAELALLLKNIQVSGASLEKMHLIGHSLGCHLAGYTGERLPGLGRITGLDPAGPYFEGMPVRVRLDPSDAQLVDVWHTDGGPLLKLGMGMDDAAGHVDFYPNGGKEQPGCSTQRITTIITEGLVMGVRRFLGCNHERAIQLYLQSVNTYKGIENACRAWAYPCPDWDTFKNGHCATCGTGDQYCATMDLDVTRSVSQVVKGTESKSLRLYLKTNAISPFCLHQYQITVRMTNSASAKSQSGKLILHAQDLQKRAVRIPFTESNLQLHPGATYRHLITNGQQLDLKSSKVRLEWKSDRGVLGLLFKSKIYVEQVAIKHMRPLMKNDTGRPFWEDGKTTNFAVPKGKPLVSGDAVILVPL